MMKEIVVVDDDADDRSLFIEQMQSHNGVSCTSLCGGDELLQHLESREDLPSLVVLDINMPKKDGIHTLYELRLRRRYRDLQVVILTTSERPADKKRGEELGCIGFFSKPLSFQGYRELTNVIVGMLLDA